MSIEVETFFRRGAVEVRAQQDNTIIVATELADAGLHAAHSAILYLLQARTDYLLRAHLPEQARALQKAWTPRPASATPPAPERAFSTRKASADPASKKTPRSSETYSGFLKIRFGGAATEGPTAELLS